MGGSFGRPSVSTQPSCAAAWHFLPLMQYLLDDPWGPFQPKPFYDSVVHLRQKTEISKYHTIK